MPNETPSAPPHDSLLLTDYYQLAMVQAYVENGLTDTASFELFVRTLPAGRNFLVSAGLEQAVAFLAGARLNADDRAWLRERGGLSAAAVDRLEAFHFTGDVDAMPEGTVAFANEPLLRLTAPLPEAQLVTVE